LESGNFIFTKPTHYWLMRHIFNPLRRRGYSKFYNILITFFVSAIFHEYIVSGALGIISYYAFLAMFMNFPVCIAQEFIKHSRVLILIIVVWKIANA
jgi:diacylglycerol O-acyltransferase-1